MRLAFVIVTHVTKPMTVMRSAGPLHGMNIILFFAQTLILTHGSERCCGAEVGCFHMFGGVRNELTVQEYHRELGRLRVTYTVHKLEERIDVV